MFDKSSYEVFTRAQISCIKPIFTFKTSVCLPTRQSISHPSETRTRVELIGGKSVIVSYAGKTALSHAISPIQASGVEGMSANRQNNL